MAYKQKKKSQQTRDELKASAMELFSRKGFGSTTIADITDSAGYAKGNFYRHWSSKDDIFLEIVEQKLKNYRMEREERVKSATCLADAMDIIWDFLEFTIHAGSEPRLKAELNKSRYRLSNALFADLVSDFMDTDYPPEKIGALNTALFEGFLIHSLLESKELDTSDVRRAATILAHTLGQRDGEHPASGISTASEECASHQTHLEDT